MKIIVVTSRRGSKINDESFIIFFLKWLSLWKFNFHFFVCFSVWFFSLHSVTRYGYEDETNVAPNAVCLGFHLDESWMPEHSVLSGWKGGCWECWEPIVWMLFGSLLSGWGRISSSEYLSFLNHSVSWFYIPSLLPHSSYINCPI